MGGNYQAPVSANSCQRAYWQSKRASCDTSSRETNECFGYLRMKTQTMVIVLGLAAVVATSFGRLPQAGQSQAPFPSDLVQISSNQVPGSCGNLYSMAYWAVWPPLPAGFAQVPGYSLYYSPSMNSVFLDDRVAVAGAAMMNSSESDWSFWPPGGGDTNSYDPGVSLGPVQDLASSNGLYLTISLFTNSDIPVTLHHTTAGSIYEFLSSQSLTNPLANWASEGIWMAAATNLPVSIQQGTRTNQLFFQAHLWPGTFDHGVPTNGQLFLQANTNLISAVINGVTTNLTPFYGSNWFMLAPPLYVVNLGYGVDDQGTTNAWMNKFDPQGILQVRGFSTTVSNLCLSSNLLTSIDVHGWPELQILECWRNNDLTAVSVTNCPKLNRVCFEQQDGGPWNKGIQGQVDFTGCTSLGDIRCALNVMVTNMVFGGSASQNVWHLCVRGDTLLTAPDLSQFPKLKELWCWDAQNFMGPVACTFASAPDFKSLDGHASAITSAVLGGLPNLIEVNLNDCHFLLNMEVTNSAMKVINAKACWYCLKCDVSGDTNLTDLIVNNWVSSTCLNVTGCTSLTNLNAIYPFGLSQAQIDNVLVALDQAGKHDGFVDLSSPGEPSHQNPPSVTGLMAAASLSRKNWVVHVDGPVSCSVTYNGNGSTSGSVPVDGTTYTSGDTVTVLDNIGNLARTGYTFSGWNVASDGSGTQRNAGSTFVIASSTTLYAQWNGATNTAPLWFVTGTNAVAMRVNTASGASVKWYSGGMLSAVTNGGGVFTWTTNVAIGTSNAVVVSPADKLLGISIGTDANPNNDGNNYTGDFRLYSVGGLTNYPELYEIRFYNTWLTNLSLAGCTNLSAIALVNTDPGQVMGNEWFNQLRDAGAIHHLSRGTVFSINPGWFYHPSHGCSWDSTSADARAYLTGNGWYIHQWP
jgi:uncharacterized repeat protein (TIGR02543 family)